MRVGIVALVLMSWSEAGWADEYAPLPTPPHGFKIRQVTTMPSQPVRITSDGSGKLLYILSVDGGVFTFDLPTGPLKKIVEHGSYTAFAKLQDQQCIGFTLDLERRLYVVENAHDLDARPQINHVTIYRTSPGATDFKPWLQTDVPFAVDTFQHGVSFIAQGPDGMMYVSSGSRTDHGEKGNDNNRSQAGETPVTASIWRLNPKSDHPSIEIYARGIRNAFGMCWDDRARLFATENGPNADAPEEVNLIERGKHYGFPYKFADIDHKMYDDQPDMPAGLKIELPAVKLDPHSSPSGIVYLGGDFPPGYRGTFLVARFGNMIGPKDVGFDILQIDENGAVKPFLAPVARPTDVYLCGKGKIYICEIWRQLHNAGEQSPGRILELSATDDPPHAQPSSQ